MRDQIFMGHQIKIETVQNKHKRTFKADIIGSFT